MSVVLSSHSEQGTGKPPLLGTLAAASLSEHRCLAAPQREQPHSSVPGQWAWTGTPFCSRVKKKRRGGGGETEQRREENMISTWERTLRNKTESRDNGILGHSSQPWIV